MKSEYFIIIQKVLLDFSYEESVPNHTDTASDPTWYTVLKVFHEWILAPKLDTT